jgi:hypothetical protein
VYYDEEYINAFWNSTQIVYGDGMAKYLIGLQMHNRYRTRAYPRGNPTRSNARGQELKCIYNVFGRLVKQFTLKQIVYKADWPIGVKHIDIMKVPHHGSERNSSEQFFETVTADTYIISANGRDDNPSLSTLKWIIESGKEQNRKITIVATNKTENTDKALQMYDPYKFQYSFIFLDPQASFMEIDTKK